MCLQADASWGFVVIVFQIASITLKHGSDGKICNVEDLNQNPGSGRSPAEGNGNPLQCSCLENPTDGRAW